MWVKLDDRFWCNRKVRKAGDAIGAYILALTWSADQLTDGRIPVDELDFICHGFDDPNAAAERLEEVGLFVLDGDDWVIPDYLEFNESAETIKERRAKDRERKSKGGARRGSERNPDGIQTESGSPVPVPVPVPVSPNGDTGHADTPQTQTSETDPIDVELCEHLRDRIHQHTGNRLKIPDSWHNDMSRLRRLGPTDLEGRNPKTPTKIRASIDFIFDRLNEHGNDGFCWADVIRSPRALRKHWLKLEDAYKRTTASPTNTTHVPEMIGVDIAFAMMKEGAA